MSNKRAIEEKDYADVVVQAINDPKVFVEYCLDHGLEIDKDLKFIQRVWKNYTLTLVDVAARDQGFRSQDTEIVPKLMLAGLKLWHSSLDSNSGIVNSGVYSEYRTIRKEIETPKRMVADMVRLNNEHQERGKSKYQDAIDNKISAHKISAGKSALTQNSAFNDGTLGGCKDEPANSNNNSHFVINVK